MTIPDLIARVEAAEGPDRELDVAIYLRIFGDRPFGCCGPFNNPKPGSLAGYHAAYKSVINSDDAIPDDVVPRYTSDLNAVVAMIPDGYSRWAVTGRNSATVGRPGNPETKWVFAATPALALLAACLRARG